MTREFRIDRASLHSLISSFANKRVLVIGDMVADEYLIGKPTRIAREAPVLILELDEERTIPGGALPMLLSMLARLARKFFSRVLSVTICQASVCVALLLIWECTRRDS